MKKLLLLGSVLITMGASPVFALTFDVFNVDSEGVEIASWISGLGGQVNVLEDFEGFAVDGTTNDWHGSLATGVGTFITEGSDKGTGATSYNGINNPNSQDPYFSIQANDNSWYGRENTTPGGRQWLDSGDITLLTLTGIDSSLKNLFFYLQDPSDVHATTTIGAGSLNFAFQPGQANGLSYFVGITLANNETLSDISWGTTNSNDGYGLDDFSTVAPVPEPATMLLFGTGLVGLVGTRFKRKKK